MIMMVLRYTTIYYDTLYLPYEMHFYAITFNNSFQIPFLICKSLQKIENRKQFCQSALCKGHIYNHLRNSFFDMPISNLSTSISIGSYLKDLFRLFFKSYFLQQLFLDGYRKAFHSRAIMTIFQRANHTSNTS